ncbi:MAG: DUF1446 domain-containing protein [Novosphingobium sp.]|nr:DUF1446 domain-containing protein [Novosphingobium sp.]
MTGVVRIGGASAGFIDSAIAVPQLLAAGVDFLAFDFMGEGNMPILARRRDEQGQPAYMEEFVEHMRNNLGTIMRQGVRVVANAGGLDPEACARALEKAAADLGLAPRIAWIGGDNLVEREQDLRDAGKLLPFGREKVPPGPSTTANAYFGAFPIAAALDRGAQIVVTGRIVDSAASLGPLIHAFGWTAGDYDRLAAGTLIGHLLECGAHVTGGLFTDWRDVPDWANIGYPIAECRADGSAVITKPEETGGLVSVGTVAEQMLYEVGDPARYLVPDVACDFGAVTMQQVGRDRVEVTGARGHPPEPTYKVILTRNDGWRGYAVVPVSGIDAVAKAERIGAALVERTRSLLRQRNMADWRATRVEAIGGEGSYGAQRSVAARTVRETTLRIVADHDTPEGAALMVREHFSAGVSMAPGNACSPLGLGVTALHRLGSALIAKSDVTPRLHDAGGCIEVTVPAGGPRQSAAANAAPEEAELQPCDMSVPLVQLAWVRSGDKGNIANVAVIARDARFAPYIRAALDPAAVGEWYAHLFESDADRLVQRFDVPGIHALNFMLHDALDGGMTVSLRYDPMGKGLAQQLLDFPVPVPAPIAAAGT